MNHSFTLSFRTGNKKSVMSRSLSSARAKGDGEVTSERQFALSIGASEISVNDCVAVFDLYEYKWQGLTALRPDDMAKF